MEFKFLITFFYTSGTHLTKIEDDSISIMSPHQSYFDEYPSGTGKINCQISSDRGDYLGNYPKVS